MASVTVLQDVTVNETSDYVDDYRGEVWKIIGLTLEVHGRVSVTIAQPDNFRWCDPTDGFRPEELTPV